MADNDKLYDYATLKNEKGKILYPKTKAEQVKYYDPNKKVLISQSEVNDELVPLAPKVTSQELRLKNLEELVDSLKENLKFKGVKSSEEELPIPAEGENADGWFAIVTVKNGKDKWYIYDAEEGWLDKGEATTYIYEGVKVLNGKEPVEGTLVINASDIAASINGESKTIQDVLTSLSNEQNDLANEVRTKNHVLYMTESQMEQIDEIQEGQVVVCVEDGVYTKGAIYKLISGIWEEMVVAQEKHLYGTLQEPIVLIDLEDGDYVVHNYMKPSNSYSSSTAIIDYASYAEKPYAEYRDNFLTSIHISIEKNKNSTYEKNVIFKNYSTIGHVSQEAVGTSSAFLLYGGPNPMDTIVKTTNGVINSESMSFGISMETPFYDAVGVYGYNSIFGSEALTTNNEKEYIPTKPYHPSTKKYVDQSTAIRVVEDIDSDYDGVNLFTTNKETGENNKLFMVKEVLNYSTIASNELIYKPLVKIDESIINYIVPDGVNIASTEIPVEFYKEDKITKSSYYGSLKISFTNRIITRIYWNIGGTTKNIYYKEQWTNEPMLLNINSLIPVETYPYIKIINHEDVTSELNNYILIESKEVVKDEVMLKSSSSGGTTITDTLTLSKEVIVPEIPAKEGITFNGIENIVVENGDHNYGFELKEDGYFTSLNANVEGAETYALCKLNFTLKETRDLILDVVYSGETNFDYPIFSNIDTVLSTSAYENDLQDDINNGKVFKEYKTEHFTGELVYPNVPSGDHFITVKYRKDGSNSTYGDCVKFKASPKSLDQPAIPEDKYTSSSSITIGDNNNLQINNKNILKDGDSPKIKEIIGSEENPIVLFDLESGFYVIGGYFKTIQSNQTLPIYTKNNDQMTITKTFVRIFDLENGNRKSAFFENAMYLHEIGVEVSSVHSYNGAIGSFISFDLYGNVSNDRSLNLDSYYEGYVVDEKINQIKTIVNEATPIVNVGDPKEMNNTSNINRLYGYSDYNNDSLYYSKLINEETKVFNIVQGEKYKKLKLKKDILNAGLSYEGDNIGGASIFAVDVSENGSLWGNLWFDFSASGSQITYIQSNYGDVIYDGNQWSSSGGTDEEYFDIENYLKTNHISPDAQNIEFFVTSFQTSFGLNGSDYTIGEGIEKTIKPIKVGQPIKEIADPTSVTEEKYKNDFGTSTNVEDEALYYYKSTGAESGDYSSLTTNIDYNKVLIDKNLASYYPQNGLGETVTIVQLDIKDESKNKLGSITIQADISPVGELFRLFYQETDIGIYSIEVGTWGEYGNDSYYDILSYVKTISGYENAKYLSVASNISQDTYPDIYENGYQKYFVGEVKQAAVKPVRVALYSDLENAGGSGSSIELVGTEDNPISLYELTPGTYSVTGFVKTRAGSSKVYEVKNGSFLILRDTQYCLFFNYVGHDGTTFDLKSTSKCMTLIYINDSLDYFNSTSFNINIAAICTALNGDGGKVLTTTNATTYTPSLDYNPATKKYVDDTAETVRPIIDLDNPSSITDSKYANMFVANTDLTDLNIYFVKKIGEIPVYTPIELSESYANIVISENILDFTYSANQIYQRFNMLYEDGMTATLYLYIDFSESLITKIYVKVSIYEYVLYESGEWKANKIDKELLNSTKKLTLTATTFYSGVRSLIDAGYITTESIDYTVKPYKIALTEVE